MADPTMLDPEIVHAQKLFAETLSPEKIGITLESADNVVTVNFGKDPLLLAPDAGAIGPSGLADAGIEKGFPVIAVELLKRIHVVLDVEEATGTAAVNNLIKRI